MPLFKDLFGKKDSDQDTKSGSSLDKLLDNFLKEVDETKLKQKFPNDYNAQLSAYSSAITKIISLWKNGDPAAWQILQKVIRREIDGSNMHKDKLRDIVFSELVKNPQNSVNPMLEMIIDDAGELQFSKEKNAYLFEYPEKIVKALGEIALNGYDYQSIAYRILRIGSKVEYEIAECGGQKNNTVTYALFNINNRFFKGDDAAFVSSFPKLTELETRFLVEHKYIKN